MDASKKRLENLNYFSRVEVYPEDTLVPGRKDVNVQLEEKRTGSFNFGAGFSSIDSLLGFAEVTQSNFDITKFPTFTGGGERFRIRIQYGVQRKDFVISLTEPYFLDQKLSTTGELFFREASFVSNVYSERRYGFDIQNRKALSDFVFLRFGYKLEDVGLTQVDPSASQTIKDQAKSMLKSELSVGLTYDTRDSVFLTRRGEKVDLSIYTTGGFLGAQEQIYGWDAQASKYFHLPGDTILTVIGEAGMVSPWGPMADVPLYDRLFLGGANNLRGFLFRYATPKDVNGEPLGGDTLVRGTAEFTYPIVEKVRGAFFYDGGFVNTQAYKFTPSKDPNGTGGFNSDFGFGFRVELPIGPIRVDYGIPITHDHATGGGGKFNFNIGYQF
jgi:outer membrane protein insertion porin family